MKRREFISLVGVAATWPVLARGQQRQQVNRVGVLMNLAADDPEAQARNAAFLQGLQQFGWSVGRNVQIDTRWGVDDVDRARRYTAELVALAPDVILAVSGATMSALLQATRRVPIVFVGI